MAGIGSKYGVGAVRCCRDSCALVLWDKSLDEVVETVVDAGNEDEFLGRDVHIIVQRTSS